MEFQNDNFNKLPDQKDDVTADVGLNISDFDETFDRFNLELKYNQI